jgi:hypothetical protein
VIDVNPKLRYKYICSVDAFVIHGPNPERKEYEGEHNWLIGVDNGLTDEHRGFQLRKELAYELTRLLSATLPEAGFVEKKFVHHDYGMEHLYIVIDKHKKDGTEMNVSELKAFVKKAVDTINNKNFPGMQPVITFTEKTWEDIALGVLAPKHARGWSIE